MTMNRTTGRLIPSVLVASFLALTVATPMTPAWSSPGERSGSSSYRSDDHHRTESHSKHEQQEHSKGSRHHDDD
jgi:uncharacterized membrane-anchored protein